MGLPGTTVTTRATAPPRSAPTDTGVAFVAGIAQKGPAAPVAVQSLDDFVASFGARQSYSYLYDWLDVFFQEGGAKAYVARVVGPTPVYAHVNLLDGSSVISLIVTAKQYGAWINGYKIVVTGTGPYTITVEDAASNVLETSGSLTTQLDAVTWSAGSAYVTITLGSSALIPAPVTATLASGTDDYANATDTEYATTLALFTPDLGPGQVAMPGRTTATAHGNLIAHAAANNRRALLDYTDTGTAGTLETAAATDTAVANSQYAAAFAPWVIAPGVTPGTTRTVPHSAFAAGLMARNDNAGVSPNQPSAGTTYGAASFIIGLSQNPWNDTDRAALNNAGVNVAMAINSVITEFGYRTLAPTNVLADWLLLSNSRLVMAIVAQAKVIGQRYVFAQIDGRGLLFSEFYGDLKAMLTPYYNDGSLYGATPADAFTVDVGPSVNTPQTIAAGQLKSLISVALSPDAEQVPIQIVTEPIFTTA